MNSDIVVHAIGRIAMGKADDFRGYTRGRHMGWDIFQNDASSSDPGAGANGDVSQDFGSCSDQDAVVDFWVAVSPFLSGPTERHFVQDGDIVSDHGGFPDDNASGMIKEDALANCGGGMYVDRKNLADDTLQIASHDLPIPIPEKMGNAVGGQGLEAFKIENWGKKTPSRRVSAINGQNIEPHTAADFPIGSECLFKQFVKIRFRDRMMSQLARDPMCKAGFQ